VNAISGFASKYEEVETKVAGPGQLSTMDPGGAVDVNIAGAKVLETTEPRSVKKQIPITHYPGDPDLPTMLALIAPAPGRRGPNVPGA
jgi:hypothetical protein